MLRGPRAPLVVVTAELDELMLRPSSPRDTRATTGGYLEVGIYGIRKQA